MSRFNGNAVRNSLLRIHNGKRSLKDAITSLGGNLNGVPFDQWANVLLGLRSGQGSPEYEGGNSPVSAPSEEVALPPEFSVSTAGLTPIATAFAYGALEFDFTGEQGAVGRASAQLTEK